MSEEIVSKISPGAALEVLEQARQLLSAPERWTQEWFARDTSGNEVPFDHERAVCWCLNGAVRKFSNYNSDLFLSALLALQEQVARHGGVAASVYNDTHTHVEVLAVLDAAIAKQRAALARAEGQVQP